MIMDSISIELFYFHFNELIGVRTAQGISISRRPVGSSVYQFAIAISTWKCSKSVSMYSVVIVINLVHRVFAKHRTFIDF